MTNNHIIDFSMGQFDLSEPESVLLPKMQLVSDYWMQQYFGKPMGTIRHVTILDEDTCTIEIERELDPDACCALGPHFIGEYDEALTSGLEPEHFSLWRGKSATIKPIVAPLIPMGKAMYTPTDVFANCWKRINKQVTGEDIQRVKFTITPSNLTIYVKFARTTVGNQKRYADDVHDLEMEIGDTLGNHRGETFSWPLWEMGEICARKYLKKKSYQGLIGYLKKTYDIELNIKDY